MRNLLEWAYEFLNESSRRLPGLSYGGQSLAARWGHQYTPSPRCENHPDRIGHLIEVGGGDHALCYDCLKQMYNSDPIKYGWLKRQQVI